MSDKKKILVVAAHPDDEVLGVGGTIAYHSGVRGDEVYVLILTEGCSSQYRDDPEVLARKKEEARKANKILGVKELIFEDLPDMRLDSLEHVELNRVVEKNIRRIEPDIVFTQHPDVNKDHVLVYESTMVATRPVPGQCVKKVYTYASASSTEWIPSISKDYFVPNTFFDITDTLDKKIEAFECYGVEQRAYPHPRSSESIRIYAGRDGISVGLKAAEPFVLVRSIEN